MELEPCPCCQGRARLVTYKKRIGTACPYTVFRQHVECTKCGMRSKYYKQPDKAAPAWNTRRTPATKGDEELVAEMAAAMEELVRKNGIVKYYADYARAILPIVRANQSKPDLSADDAGLVEPLPCPFCGSAVQWDDELDIVRCNHCIADGPWMPGQTKEQAIAAWNTRTPSANQSDEILGAYKARERLDAAHAYLANQSDEALVEPDSYSVVGEILEYFDSYNLATWAPVASIIERERAAARADEREKVLDEAAKVAEAPFDWGLGQAPLTYRALANNIGKAVRALKGERT